MRVLVATTAGAGHFAGVLPFARACVDVGHDVRVAAPASFADAVQSAGFTHEPLADADPAAMAAVFGRIPTLTMHEADDLVIQEVFGRLDLRAALPGMQAIFDRWQPDVVLREPAELSSYVTAHTRGVPHVQANIGLSSFDDRILPLLDAPLDEVSCGSTALRTAPRWTTVPLSFDLPSELASGPVVRAREPAAAAGPPEPLPDWWSGSEAPLVYLTFGSVAATIGLYPACYAAAIERLGDLPLRVLLTVGEAADPGALGAVPGNVHVERWWPQRAVLPHAAVVIGHGGFGTTQAALAAGVPQVVVPLFSFDQFANAERVTAAGVGVALVDGSPAERRASDVVVHGLRAVQRLGDAVAGLLGDEAVQRAARELAAEIDALSPATACAASLEAMPH